MVGADGSLSVIGMYTAEEFDDGELERVSESSQHLERGQFRTPLYF
jgi:hypothetical protein